MIRSIYSTLPTFKNLDFHDGLNMVLAQKTSESTERQTRNRAGKSSITEIIHFLMAGNIEKNSIFNEESLTDEYFGMDFDLGEHPVTVERQPFDRTIVKIVNGEYAHWPIQPNSESKNGIPTTSNKSWKQILGRIMFALQHEVGKYGPSFRSMFSYFVRRASDGGFIEPSMNCKNQHPSDMQVNISYLMGLDWTIPQQWQMVRDKEKALKSLGKAAKEGALGDVISTSSDLRTKITVKESRASHLRENLANFKVLPEYESIENEASELTRNISRLSDENTLDRQLVADINESIEKETPPTERQVGFVYERAGIELPGMALKRFEDVRAFHQSVVANRQSYLEGELANAHQRIAEREKEIAKQEERRAVLMRILQTHGALEHFSRLQGELNRIEADIENLKNQHATAEKIETGKTELNLEREHLLRQLRRDHDERSDVLREAILAFEEVSQAMYEEAGALVIDESINGPRFDIKIQGKRSTGISNMQIFCFDMMLMKLCANRDLGPGFLFHDSHLFDGVDERQVAKALEIGANLSDQLGFQYIVTMNEDKVPSDFDADEYAISTRLTDATEDGGLFGIRFG